MASGGSGERAPGKKFPVQLAQGVLQDLLAKELDAHFFSDDGTKRAALTASREVLPRRSALLTSQIGAADSTTVTEGVFELVIQLWTFIRSHPLVARIEPAFLDGSLWLETLSSLFRKACAAAGLFKTELLGSGPLVTVALVGVGTSDEPFSTAPAATVAQLIKLVRWWGDDVCGRRWGIEKPWGSFVDPTGRKGPLLTIAAKGLAALVPLAVEKGCPVNEDSKGSTGTAPAAVAFANGHIDVVEALLAHGLDLLRPYHGDGWPLALTFFIEGRGKVAFLADLLRRWPDIVRARSSNRATLSLNLLDAAIYSKDPAIVDLALSAGAKPQFGFKMVGSNITMRPPLAAALMIGNARIVELVITKGQVLEGWKEKYDSQALGDISTCLARLAISAYPSNSLYKSDPKHLIKHNPQAMECLELVLASEFAWSWDREGRNSLIANLYNTDDHNETHCLLEEKHAIALLKRYYNAGFDVVNGGRDIEHLPRTAMEASQCSVLDFYLSELQGAPDVDVDPASGERVPTLLTCALSSKNIPCALLLLEKYKVRAAYPARPIEDQPVCGGFLARLNEYSDCEAEQVLRALIERDPELFAIPCFSAASIAEQFATARRRACDRDSGSGIVYRDLWNPVYMLTLLDKRQALEFLLKKKFPGVQVLASHPMPLRSSVLTPAQLAAGNFKWECLSLILRYTDARVTDTFDDKIPSAAELVRRSAGKVGGAPRTLVTMVEARAEKELAENAAKANTAAASQAAGAVSNAFEDPSVKPLTEKEEKAKTKKKAAKKKAKAKKRAANAGAGSTTAGAEATDSDDSSSDDNDVPREEEPDDNLVDSRNAPSLDLLLEQMGLKQKE